MHGWHDLHVCSVWLSSSIYFKSMAVNASMQQSFITTFDVTTVTCARIFNGVHGKQNDAATQIWSLYNAIVVKLPYTVSVSKIMSTNMIWKVNQFVVFSVMLGLQGFVKNQVGVLNGLPDPQQLVQLGHLLGHLPQVQLHVSQAGAWLQISVHHVSVESMHHTFSFYCYSLSNCLCRL